MEDHKTPRGLSTLLGQNPLKKNQAFYSESHFCAALLNPEPSDYLPLSLSRAYKTPYRSPPSPELPKPVKQPTKIILFPEACP